MFPWLVLQQVHFGPSAVVEDKNALPKAQDRWSKAKDGTQIVDVGDLSVHSQAVLKEAQHLITEEYNVLGAEALVQKLQQELRNKPKEWAAVRCSEAYRLVYDGRALMARIGEACSQDQRNWFVVLQDEAGAQSVTARIDDNDSRIIHYRAIVEVPFGLSEVMVVTNEVELGTLWQTHLVRAEAVGKRSAHRLLVHGLNTVMGGLVKADTLNEVQRFINVEGGFLAERLMKLPEDHPEYMPPEPGFRRAGAEVYNVYICLGQHRTCMVQVGFMQLPLPTTRWIVQTFGGLIWKGMVSGIYRNAAQVSQPGTPWEAARKKDAEGFYALLARCEKAKPSMARAKAPLGHGAKLAPELRDWCSNKLPRPLERLPEGEKDARRPKS